MNANTLRLLRLLGALHRSGPARARSARPPIAVAARSAISQRRSEEPQMPNEEDFLRKHHSDGSADDAIKAAQRRLIDSPPHITTSTVIYGIAWTDLLNRMFIAVINAGGGSPVRADLAGDPGGMAYAVKIFSAQYGEQWNIVLTGLNYVDVTRHRKGKVSEDAYEEVYKISKFRNGNVFITARAVKDEPGLLGEVVHLTTGFGSTSIPSP